MLSFMSHKELFETYRPEPYSDFSDPAVVAQIEEAIAAVKTQLGQDYPLHIGAEKLTTDTWISSYNPCQTSELIGRTAAASTDDVERAFDAAETAFADWKDWTMEARARSLIKLAAVMRRRKWELSAWEVLEASKNFAEAEADVAEAIDFCEYYARQALKLGEMVTGYDYPGEENSSFLMPMGVGLVIPPWNFLLAILVGTSVAPVVVGNTVIVKPSPDTPIIAQKFMECLEEAGFPKGVINLVTGEDKEIGDYLVDNIRTRFINFTGSMQTGIRINERAAKVNPGQKWIKKVYLEMGGKDALIVDETADLDYAADAAVRGGYGFQGQKCSAMSRLIVVEDVYDALLEKFVARVQELNVGAAEKNAPVGAVINQKAVDKIMHYIDNGKVEARLVCGGERAEVEGFEGFYIQPTVFADVPRSASIACEEIFGPVVAVMKAKDYDDALAIANSTIFALTGGVISKDRARLEQARREFNVGNLYLNRKITGALVGVQPFGGFNMSGSNSKAGGPDYLRLFMEMKTVSERW